MLDESHLVWIDLETTGLDPLNDKILEIASIITDKDLQVLAEGPVIAVSYPDHVLDAMDPWCIRVHGESGLTDRCRASSITIEKAERMTLDFISKYVPKRCSPLCGNSVHQDRHFMVKEMPDLAEYLHYRLLDVSVIKEFVKRWVPSVSEPQKKLSHEALADIRESIEELRHYKEFIGDRIMVF